MVLSLPLFSGSPISKPFPCPDLGTSTALGIPLTLLTIPLARH